MLKVHLPAKHFARLLLADLKIDSYPVDVEHICDRLNIVIRHLALDTAEAIFILRGGEKYILINENQDYRPRLRFTIAHELGHYCIPWHDQSVYGCNPDQIGSYLHNNKREREADEFASALLMPEETLRSTVGKSNFDLDTLDSLCKEYEVSLTSMAIRFLELSSDLAAVFLSCGDGVILWGMRTDSMRVNLRTGRLHQGSRAYRMLNSPRSGLIDGPTEVDAGCWFDRDGRVVEESRLLGTRQVLSIITVPDSDYDHFYA